MPRGRTQIAFLKRTFLVAALLVGYDGVEAHGEGADGGVCVQKRSSKETKTCVVFWYEGL
jgi:hypothetical protein